MGARRVGPLQTYAACLAVSVLFAADPVSAALGDAALAQQAYRLPPVSRSKADCIWSAVPAGVRSHWLEARTLRELPTHRLDLDLPTRRAILATCHVAGNAEAFQAGWLISARDAQTWSAHQLARKYGLTAKAVDRIESRMPDALRKKLGASIPPTEVSASERDLLVRLARNAGVTDADAFALLLVTIKADGRLHALVAARAGVRL